MPRDAIVARFNVLLHDAASLRLIIASQMKSPFSKKKENAFIHNINLEDGPNSIEAKSTMRVLYARLCELQARSSETPCCTYGDGLDNLPVQRLGSLLLGKSRTKPLIYF